DRRAAALRARLPHAPQELPAEPAGRPRRPWLGPAAPAAERRSRPRLGALSGEPSPRAPRSVVPPHPERPVRPHAFTARAVVRAARRTYASVTRRRRTNERAPMAKLSTTTRAALRENFPHLARDVKSFPVRDG